MNPEEVILCDEVEFSPTDVPPFGASAALVRAAFMGALRLMEEKGLTLRSASFTIVDVPVARTIDHNGRVVGVEYGPEGPAFAWVCKLYADGGNVYEVRAPLDNTGV